jgi:hypothetical protein
LWFCKWRKTNEFVFVWILNLLFFCFLFFFDSSSDEDDLDLDKDEFEADNERVRFDFFFDFEDIIFITGFSSDKSLVFFRDGLSSFLCERSTLKLDDDERILAFSVAWCEALLAADEVDEELWWYFSVFREDFIGLRLCEGDFDGKRCRFEVDLRFFFDFSWRSFSLSLLFEIDRIDFFSVCLNIQKLFE